MMFLRPKNYGAEDVEDWMAAYIYERHTKMSSLRACCVNPRKKLSTFSPLKTSFLLSAVEVRLAKSGTKCNLYVCSGHTNCPLMRELSALKSCFMEFQKVWVPCAIALHSTASLRTWISSLLLSGGKPTTKLVFFIKVQRNKLNLSFLMSKIGLDDQSHEKL